MIELTDLSFEGLKLSLVENIEMHCRLAAVSVMVVANSGVRPPPKQLTEKQNLR